MMPFYLLLFVLSQNDFVENVVTLVKSFEDPKETLEMWASVLISMISIRICSAGV